MVKCSDIIDDKISETMKIFSQDSQVESQYRQLVKNILNNQFFDTDLKKMIESLKVDDD